MNQILKNTLAVLTNKEKQRFQFLIFFDVLISILDISSLAFLVFIIHFYTSDNPVLNFQFLPKWLLNHNSVWLIAMFFLLFSIKNLAGYFILRWQYLFVYRVASRISETNLLNYLEGNYSDYVNVDSAVHIRKINQQPIEFSQYVLSGIQQIISQSILISLAITAILIYNFQMFLLLLVILLPPVLLTFYFLKKKLRSVRIHTKTSGEKALQHLKEALSGFVESNIYGRNAFFTNRYARMQERLNHYLSELQIVHGMPSRLIEVFAILGLFILILIQKHSENVNSSEVVTIGAFMAAAYRIIPGIVKILNLNSQVKTYQFTIQKILFQGTESKNGNRAIVPSIEGLGFNNIFFNYNQKQVLQDFSLHIEAGDFLGITGSSGIGKTTIINLLLGFISPHEGEIEINGVAINSKERKRYWEKISYVKQEPFLIHDTILRNIILEEDSYDKQKLEDIIRITRVVEKSSNVNDGLKKLITENGKNISGGQRQRINIARSLYKDADLYILDEPFSELDKDSEECFLQHFVKLSKQGKLIILITHHKESLSVCNKRITLNE